MLVVLTETYCNKVKVTAIFSLVFPNGYSLILCFDAIQSDLLKESLHEQLHTCKL